MPVCGTLRGAGDEKVGRCFEGVLFEGVGVAIVNEGCEAPGGYCCGEYVYGGSLELRCYHVVLEMFGREKEANQRVVVELTRVRSWHLKKRCWKAMVVK